MHTPTQAPAVVYEIVNPSDAYTMEASDLAVAAVACLYLGNGQYGLRAVHPDDAPGVPVFMFGKTADVERWFAETCGCTMAAAFARRAAVADALDSVLAGSLRDRQTNADALALIDDEAKRQEWREKWLDRRRSSLNNIGGRAMHYAKHLREAIAQGAPA
jgi:hypothetical protein